MVGDESRARVRGNGFRESGGRAPRGLEWRVATGVLVTLGLAATAPAAAVTVQDAEYECTIIASSAEFPVFDGVPALNAYGQVAFAARTSLEYSLRSGTGEVDMQGVPISNAVVEIPFGVPPDPNAQLIMVRPPTIDDQGRLVFSGTEDPPIGPSIQGIYRKRFDEPAANDAERLVVDQFGLPTSAIAVIRPGRPIYGNTNGRLLFTGLQAGDTTDVVLRATNTFLASSLGVVSEYAQHRGRQPYVVFTRFAGNLLELLFDPNSGTIQTIEVVDPANRWLTGLSMAGNLEPLAAWVEQVSDTPGTRFRIRLAGPLVTETLVDDGIDTTGYSNLTNARPAQAAVNSYGEVVFGGYPSEPILVTDGDVLRRVVCRDQLALFGVLPFSNFFVQALSPQSFNNDGQIAFLAGNGFGGRWVLRADPISTARPTSCVGLVDDTPCDDGDPESVAYCSAQICTAVPEPGFAAGLFVAVIALSVRGRGLGVGSGPASRGSARVSRRNASSDLRIEQPARVGLARRDAGRQALFVPCGIEKS